MKIATKTLSFDDPNAGAGVANFLVYYKQAVEGKQPPFAYEDPHATIPAVQGQIEYQIQIPSAAIPITEGQWAIAFAAADAEGNISDFAVLMRFFDFTAPLAPTNLRVL